MAMAGMQAGVGVRKSTRLFSRPRGDRNGGGETPDPCKT
jgi:hypothetical protein